jgi:uncharacterized caspase-like protein
MRCFLLIGCWLLTTSTRAQQTYAVIVGVSTYQHGSARPQGNQIQNLNFSDDDARRFYQFLRSPAGGSVPTAQMHLITNEKASRTNLLRALKLFRRAGANDRVIFYFSGHGAPGFFVPFDATPDGRANLLTHAELKEAFRASAARTKFCIADACHAGSIRRPGPAAEGTPAGALDQTSVVVFMSARANEYSLERGTLRQGVFSYFLIKGLSGMADQNRDRRVSAYELYAYVRQNVQQQTQGRQTPIAYGRFSKELPLAQVAP